MEYYSFEHEFIISEKELKDGVIYHQYPFFINGKLVLFHPSIFQEKLQIDINFRLNAKIFDTVRGKIGFFNKSAKFQKYPNIYRSLDIPGLYQEICEMKDILNPEKNFIENGKFKLQMKGIFFCDKSDEKQIFQTTLGQHLWERDDRDFVISVGKNGEDKTEIKIHKLILASRSPVFDAMLKAEMKEKVENRIEIVDFGVEIVEAAVDFFYDQESYVMLDLDNLIGLLQFADKYDVKDLKRKIENQLFDLLHPTNICQIVNASIISNSQMLKDICLSSMIVFHCQKVLIENLEILDKDFAFELVQKSFSSVI